MKFSYQAKDSAGNLQEGKIEAANSNTAVTMLQEKRLIPLVVEKEKELPAIAKDLMRIWHGVKPRELSVFFRQLSTLMEAKVPIAESLKAVGNQTSNAYLKTVVEEMVNDIEDGSPFSESMQKHPEVFKPLMVNMTKAGELSGNLQRSVFFVAENTEKNYELTSKIKGALFYPIFVLTASLIIGFIVVTFVLPKLTNIFKELNVAVPWYTKVLMVVGDFMSKYWWAVGVAIIFLIISGIYYVKTEEGRKEWDIIKTKIPIIGPLFEYVYVARFSENLGVLMLAGIPIVRALIIVSEVVNNTSYASVILRAADEVKTGGTMSSVFSRTSHFPPIVSQMIKIGEDSGKISEVLMNVSSFYSKEVDRMTRNLSTMLEPILICILGAVVAFMVFAILVPIYDITGAL